MRRSTIRPQGHGASPATSKPRVAFTLRRYCPTARSWPREEPMAPLSILGNMSHSAAQNYTTQQQAIGVLPPVSIQPVILIQPHCCLMERSWPPQDIILTPRSYTTRPQGSGVSPPASAHLALVTQRHYFRTARSSSLETTQLSCTTQRQREPCQRCP